MADDLHPDLDQLLAQGGERPVLELLGVIQCRLLATSGGSGHVAGTTALPLRADLRAATSALPPISSASPQGTDLPGGPAVGPVLTRGGHSVDCEVQQVPHAAKPFCVNDLLGNIS